MAPHCHPPFSLCFLFRGFPCSLPALCGKRRKGRSRERERERESSLALDGLVTKRRKNSRPCGVTIVRSLSKSKTGMIVVCSTCQLPTIICNKWSSKQIIVTLNFEIYTPKQSNVTHFISNQQEIYLEKNIARESTSKINKKKFLGDNCEFCVYGRSFSGPNPRFVPVLLSKVMGYKQLDS